MPLPDRETFTAAYEGQAPWDIGRPQAPLVQAADQVKGAVLDCGCGTGDSALFFAERGHRVTGIDFLEEPIRRAQQKAADRKLDVKFLVHDAQKLVDLHDQFETAIDSGLFHVFDDEARARYVEGLSTVVRPEGMLYLLCFSDAEPAGMGPRRISEAELREAFVTGWNIESLEACRFEINPAMKDLPFSPGGPKAWFARIRRVEPE